jgi:hypothetical protein
VSEVDYDDTTERIGLVALRVAPMGGGAAPLAVTVADQRFVGNGSHDSWPH